MNKALFIYVVACILLSSCSHVIYIPLLPEKVTSPGLGEKNEGKLDISTSTNTDLSVHAAYAPVEHFAVIGSYSSFTNHQSDNDSTATSHYETTLRGKRADIGIGYFTSFNNTGRFEVYTGYGFGSISGEDTYTQGSPGIVTSYDISVRTKRWFLQTGIGYEGNIFSCMGGLKIGSQTYYNLHVGSPDVLVIAEGPFYFQPYFDMRLGYKYVKFTTQIGFSYGLTQIIQSNGQSSTTIGLFPMPYISAGLVFNYAPRFLKKQKTTTPTDSH